VKKILILLIILIFNQLHGRSPDFYFAQLTDTHWGPKKHSLRLQKAIRFINKMPMKIDFVIHTGDLSSNNMTTIQNTKKIRAEFKKLKMPIYFVAGNHDVQHYSGKQYLKRSRLLYQKYFSPLNYVKYHKGLALIFLFAEPVRENYTLPGHKPWKWLTNTLYRNRYRSSLIFQHTPMTRDFYKSNTDKHHKFRENWKKQDRSRYKYLINRYGNVRGVISGHYHRSELYWIGKVPQHVCSSIAGYWGRQGSFRIYHYKNHRLSFHTIYIKD